MKNICSSNAYVRLFLLIVILLVHHTLTYAQECNSFGNNYNPNSRYIISGNGTVTDKKTGLMWIKCEVGLSGPQCDQGTVLRLTWQEALQMPSNNEYSSYAGYTDWRLPNIKELRSLIAFNCLNPAINEEVFPGPNGEAWSSTPDASYPNEAKHISFRYGDVSDFSRDYRSYGARLVRNISQD